MFLPREPKPGQRLDASWGAGIVRYLRSITLRPGVDYAVNRNANGTRISPRAGGKNGGEAAAEIEPGSLVVVTSRPAGAVLPDPLPANPLVWVTWGHVNNVIPDNIATGIEISVATTDVYLEVTIDPDIPQVLSATLKTVQDEPTGMNTDGSLKEHYYYLLGRVTADVSGANPVIARVRNAGEGSLWFGAFVADVTADSNGIGIMVRNPIWIRR